MVRLLLYILIKGSHSISWEPPPSCLVETFALPQGLSGKPRCPCMSFTLTLICRTCTFSPRRLSYTKQLRIGLAFLSLTPAPTIYLPFYHKRCSKVRLFYSFNYFSKAANIRCRLMMNWTQSEYAEIEYSHKGGASLKVLCNFMRITTEFAKMNTYNAGT